jgi:hypothetical protein
MAVDESRRFSVGLISNDFDANEFQRGEEEQEEDRIGDVVISDSDDSDDDQRGLSQLDLRNRIEEVS